MRLSGQSDAPSDQACGLGYAPGAMDLRDGPDDVAFRAEVRRFLDENLVEVHVSHLRAKLEKHGPRVIHTIRSVGYVLDVDREA